MPLRLVLAVVAALVAHRAAAQPADATMQNLLAGLTRGSEVTLYTPLVNGMLQVTRFRAPIAVPRPQAEAAVAIARQHLRMLDIPYPTAYQLARALVGGTIETRDGPQALPGVLPQSGAPPIVTTEVVLANGQPPVPASGSVAASAAGGGSAPPRYPPPLYQPPLYQAQ
jgi:hypothetical protein